MLDLAATQYSLEAWRRSRGPRDLHRLTARQGGSWMGAEPARRSRSRPRSRISRQSERTLFAVQVASVAAVLPAEGVTAHQQAAQDPVDVEPGAAEAGPRRRVAHALAGGFEVEGWRPTSSR